MNRTAPISLPPWPALPSIRYERRFSQGVALQHVRLLKESVLAHAAGNKPVDVHPHGAAPHALRCELGVVDSHRRETMGRAVTLGVRGG